MGIWSQAGKPDYAKCAEIISRFDPQLRESLSRSEGKALQWTLYYCWRQGTKPGQSGSYCSFSQEAIGAKLQRSRWTVSRALVRLSQRGLISSLRRRPSISGAWQTSLYFLSDKLKAILSRILKGSVKVLPSAEMLHKNSEKTIKAGALPLPVRAASQDDDIAEEKPTWQPTMKLSELVKQLNPGRFTPKLAS